MSGPENAIEDPDRLKDELEELELLRWLGVSLNDVEPGYAVFDLPFDEKFTNIESGTIHGGITATIIDTASGFAIRSTFDDPPSAQLTTTDLNVRYVRPAYGDIRVEANVTRVGETMGYTECDVTTVHEGERKTVATGGTSYRIFRE